jgi:hypothetical protein
MANQHNVKINDKIELIGLVQRRNGQISQRLIVGEISSISAITVNVMVNREAVDKS